MVIHMHNSPQRSIAVAVAGIDEEYQKSVLEGFFACARQNQINVSCFTAFGGVLDDSRCDVGEYNIYELIDFSQFDGAILLSNTISDAEVRDAVLQRAKESGIPAVVLDGCDLSGVYGIRIDNGSAMRSIVEHVVTKHHAERLCFIAGTVGNPEAEIRKQAFLDVLEAHQLSVDPQLMFDGTFRPADGAKVAEALLKSDAPLPDAIIAANDAMALEVMRILEKNQIRIPEDIIVTGFDNTYYAQCHYPSLTAVSRPLYDAGFLACDTIRNVLEGSECCRDYVMEAYPVFRGSCGCSDNDSIDTQEFRRKTYELLNTARSGASLMNRMNARLAEIEDEAELIGEISSFLHELECEQCSICLCNAEQPENVSGYPQYLSVPLIWNRGEIQSEESFETKKMNPIPQESGGNISFFLPLHIREKCLGYYVITNSDFPLKSIYCHSMMIDIANAMRNVRKLLQLNHTVEELDRLYVLDPLCAIYNRNGFVRTADKMFRNCVESQTSMLIAFIDMDGLKYINDHFGHEEGDYALRMLAAAIRDVSGENAVCARFGGDEFIVAAENVSDDAGEQLETRFKKQLDEINRTLRKSYPLSASIGSFVTKVQADMKLFSLIAHADQIMYEQKKRKKSRYLRKN